LLGPDPGPGRNGDGFGRRRGELPPLERLDESTTDPFGVRLLTGGGPTNTVNYSAVPVNPASVTVPYGGVGNETVVTFGNVVDGTQFKICKQETSSDANLAGSTFNFTWSYGGRSGTDALTIGSVAPGLVCSDLDLGPYVVNTLRYRDPRSRSQS
jgi:hypothetical protein